VAAKLDSQVVAAQAALQGARQKIDQTQQAVRELAITQFINGKPSSKGVDAAFRNGNPQSVALAQVFANIAVRQGQSVLDAAKAAQEDYQAGLAELKTGQKRAHDAAASVATARAAAAAAATEAKARLAKVRGELATLVAAEQARIAAAREAQNRANLARHVTPPRPSIITSPDRAPSTNVPPSSHGAAAAVAEAQRQLGKPYEWGAAGPDSFDCSGLTMWAWRAAGVSLPHYSGAQYQQTTHIPLDQLQPGDLVFFYSDLSHVGIYVGNGQMIHAPHSGDVVRYASIFSEGSPMYAGRVRG
jgi:cell wall-associated NlpC family hydrolase